MNHTFLSKARCGAKLPEFTQEQIKLEPGFFSSDVTFARRFGGPITRAFLDAVGPVDGVFDSRVHMLMPGWYPCIPGYHHDDVPRSRADGQPNYVNPEYFSEHVMAIVGGKSYTQFALGYFNLPDIPPGLGPIYKHWHELVEKSVNSKEHLAYTWDAPSETLVYFDWQSFHQGMPAVASGFRWFGRLSWNTDRERKNEIRNQTQVYLPCPMEGW